MRRAILSTAFILLACAAAGAQQRPELPAKAPVPEASPAAPAPRQEKEQKPAADEKQRGSDKKAPTTAPRPTKKPARPESTEDAGPPNPKPAEKAEPAAPEADQPKAQDDEARALAPPAVPDQACEKALREFGVRFERLAPVKGEESCGIPVPYNVTGIAPGVALEPKTEMTCHAALALARWVKGVVIPAAEALGEDVAPTAIAHASTYSCRGRNNQADAEPSEHSFGTAIDIASFAFRNHDPITVVPRAGDGTMEEAFQQAVRAGACLHFTTVLGPGSDEYHDNHLHLDVKQRSGGFRLCQ